MTGLFKNVYGLYCVLMIALMVVLSAPAHAHQAKPAAAPFWVGTGIFEAGSANLSTVTYTPYRTPNLNTEQDCNDYLAAAAMLSPGRNVKGNVLLHKIHAICVQGNSVD